MPLQPPGTVYRALNAMLVARRRLLKLDQPLRLLFNGPWRVGNELFDWYERRQGNNRFIHTIQLRKDHESPYFHEYIAFRLKGDTSNCFRIDRRQRRDESLPLDAIYGDGVEAQDTVDAISSLEDRGFGASDCLIEVTFKEDVQVHLMLLLKICRAIAQHPHARVYTLQRYNCYFYAQTIMLCTVCAISDWDGTQSMIRPAEGTKRWKSPNSTDPSILLEPISEPKVTEDLQGNLHNTFPSNTKLDYSWDHLSLLALDVAKTSPFLTHADNCTHCCESQSPHRQRSLSSEIDRLKASLSSYWEAVFHSYVDPVYNYTYKNIVCGGLWELEVEDESGEMLVQLFAEEFPEMENNWREYSRKKITEHTAALREILSPTEVCDAWEPDPNILTSIWGSNAGVASQRIVQDWEEEMTAYFASEYPKLCQALSTQAGNVCSQAHRSAINTRLGSFKERMVIEVVSLKEMVGCMLGKRGNRLMLQLEAAGHEHGGPTQQALSSDRRPVPIGQPSPWRLAKWSRYGPMRHVHIDEVQGLIGSLIHAHAIRVAQYKPLLACDAEVVERDIRAAMNDVWTNLIS